MSELQGSPELQKDIASDIENRSKEKFRDLIEENNDLWSRIAILEKENKELRLYINKKVEV